MRKLALAIAFVLMAACGQAGDTPADQPTADDPSPAPTDDSDGSDGDDGDDGNDGDGPQVSVFFMRFDDSGAWVEPEDHRLPAPTEAVARGAITLLLETQPRHPDLSTAIPEGTRLLDVNITDSVLVVDLSEEVLEFSGGAAVEGAFAQQFAHTAAQFDTVYTVRFLVEGQPVESIGGHGDFTVPIPADPWALTPITVERPTWGESLAAGPVTAAGQANTFEATVELRLLDPDGAVVEETFTTATSGSGERGTWEHTFEAPAETPGTWTIEAEEPDPSDGEGRPSLVVRHEFEVE